MKRLVSLLGDQDKTLFALEPNASVMDADIAPLGDVYRTDVIALALHRMTISSVIPPAVVGTYEVPSLAGLDTAGITKEARLGALDAMLLLYIEQSMPLSELAEHESNTTLAEAVCSRLREMELYRRHMPLIPIVSSKTLAEAAWPITFAWRDHIRDQAEYEQAEVCASVLSMRLQNLSLLHRWQKKGRTRLKRSWSFFEISLARWHDSKRRQAMVYRTLLR